MSTEIHPDGIKTVIGTSSFQERKKLDFLRRNGLTDSEIDRLKNQWASDLAEAHKKEHERLVSMLEFTILEEQKELIMHA